MMRLWLELDVESPQTPESLHRRYEVSLTLGRRWGLGSRDHIPHFPLPTFGSIIFSLSDYSLGSIVWERQGRPHGPFATWKQRQGTSPNSSLLNSTSIFNSGEAQVWQLRIQAGVDSLETFQDFLSRCFPNYSLNPCPMFRGISSFSRPLYHLYLFTR